MHHEETIIDGILHWRTTPDGEWRAYTVEALTRRVAELKAELSELRRNLVSTNCGPFGEPPAMWR
jgi:hypothetical protein